MAHIPAPSTGGLAARCRGPRARPPPGGAGRGSVCGHVRSACVPGQQGAGSGPGVCRAFFFHSRHPGGCEWRFRGFLCLSLVSAEGHHLSVCSLALWGPSGEMPVGVSGHLPVSCLSFVTGVLCVWVTSPLSHGPHVFTHLVFSLSGILMSKQPSSNVGLLPTLTVVVVVWGGEPFLPRCEGTLLSYPRSPVFTAVLPLSAVCPGLTSVSPSALCLVLLF